MGGFRARDADRDRIIEAIEAAYVDGQLSNVDRDLRVSQALTAASLDELQALTRDLQGAPVLASPPVSTRPPARSTPANQAALVRRVVLGGFALVAVAMVLIFGSIIVGFFAGTDTDSATDSGWVDVESMVEEPAVAEPQGFEMTPAGVRAFQQAYEEQFGTLDAYEAGFYPEQRRVYTQVPVRGARPRYERWTWDGSGWTQDSEASAAIGTYEIVDLGAIDVDRLLANVGKAKRSLNVQRGEITHVLVHRWSGEDPNVNIYVANEYSESGFIRTTFSGKVIGRYPYAP